MKMEFSESGLEILKQFGYDEDISKAKEFADYIALMKMIIQGAMIALYSYKEMSKLNHKRMEDINEMAILVADMWAETCVNDLKADDLSTIEDIGDIDEK